MTGAGPDRVVHLATGHRPRDPRIYGRECRTLAAAGYEVVLVTPADRPDELDGVHLVPVRPPRGRAGRLLVTPVVVWAKALRQRADVLHVHDANLLPGAFLAGLLGRTVVYDAHEDVLLTVRDRAWIPRPLRRVVAGLARLVERAAVGRSAAVICAEPTSAVRFPEDKTTVLANYPVLDEFPTAIPDRSDQSPLVVYVGDLNRQRGACELVAAMARLPEDLDVQLAVAGRISGHGLLAELEAAPGWSRVSYRGWLGRDEVQDLLASATIGVVTFLATPSQEGTQPVKLFEYFAAGLPVVASDFPLWRRLVGEPPAGVLVDPADPGAIAAAIEHLARHPEEAAALGRRGRALVEAEYRWEREAPKLLALYEGVLAWSAPDELAAGAVLVALPYPSARRPDQNPFLHAFARSMVGHGVPVTVVAPQRLPAPGLSPRHEAMDGIDVHRPFHWSLGGHGPLRAQRLTWGHRRFAAAAARAAATVPPPAFYWGHFLRPSGASAVELGRVRGRPAVIGLGEGGWAPSTQVFGSAENRAVLQAATGVVAVSQEIADRAIEDHRLDPDKVGVFPNRVDTAHFSPGDRQAARRALGLDERTFLVALVGRLEERKGPNRVAQALDLVGGDVAGLYLGRGPSPRPARPGDVVRPVTHAEVPAHLRAADVFVLPSYAEGSPNAVVEAMACGLPVVVSDRPFMREVVDEDAACFVDPAQPASIAEALRTLRDDPERRARMGEAARRQAAAVSLADRTASILDWIAPRVGAFRP